MALTKENKMSYWNTIEIFRNRPTYIFQWQIEESNEFWDRSSKN
jgi:hypothetical protein